MQFFSDSLSIISTDFQIVFTYRERDRNALILYIFCTDTIYTVYKYIGSTNAVHYLHVLFYRLNRLKHTIISYMYMYEYYSILIHILCLYLEIYIYIYSINVCEGTKFIKHIHIYIL